MPGETRIPRRTRTGTGRPGSTWRASVRFDQQDGPVQTNERFQGNVGRGGRTAGQEIEAAVLAMARNEEEDPNGDRAQLTDGQPDSRSRFQRWCSDLTAAAAALLNNPGGEACSGTIISRAQASTVHEKFYFPVSRPHRNLYPRGWPTAEEDVGSNFAPELDRRSKPVGGVAANNVAGSQGCFRAQFFRLCNHNEIVFQRPEFPS